ncbi:MAG: hypothetical protein DBY17_01900 [Oscillospiraceae bacterium]|nr:MAG: hypothetical protein DBY17_01900 [Oscillospiraceae bacterium]
MLPFAFSQNCGYNETVSFFIGSIRQIWVQMSNKYYLFTNQLTEEEHRVIVSIVKHIENGARRVGIQQIADENFVSTSFIMKLCKRLGFGGYSELFYSLSQHVSEGTSEVSQMALPGLVDNYDKAAVTQFCGLLRAHREQKIFAVGAGFADFVADYIVQRLGVCGFMVFNRVHFYDYMLFRRSADGRMVTNIEPSFIIAISQSGETSVVLNDVQQAKERGFQVVSFTRREDSTLAEMSDIVFIVNASKQALIGEVPNSFFGKVILAFEELLGSYFETCS